MLPQKMANDLYKKKGVLEKESFIISHKKGVWREDKKP